jgi:hypothetical protein
MRFGQMLREVHARNKGDQIIDSTQEREFLDCPTAEVLP